MGKGRGLLHGVRDWLFQIDVFARCEGIDGHGHMPVVGRGDKDSVELLLENLAIIDVGGRDAVGALFYGVATRPVDVAHVIHAAAGADDSDAEGVVGAEDSG
jgi:diadenosine tetraphosphatase ApaH/serine/threonine PP2A family protein phosphatase